MRDRFVFGSTGRSHGRRWLLFVSFAVVAIIVVDLAGQGFVRSSVRAAAGYLFSSGSAGVEAVENTGLFATRSGLAHENARLKAQIAQYESAVSENVVLREQNTQLSGLVHLAAAQQGVTAVVVSSLLASPYGTFLISAHEPDVARGDLVLGRDGFVIGRISDTGRSTSVVTEIFASDSAIEGLVAGHAATVDGYGGGNARATLPRDLSLTPGDLVIAPSLGGRPIGVVGSVDSDAASADQKVFIRLPMNLASLRYVYVVPAQR